MTCKQAAKQVRTEAYMVSHTRSHTAILDPTGRAKPWPSEAVVTVPRSFGSGSASEEAVAKVAARHRGDVDLQGSCLMPARYRWVFRWLLGFLLLAHPQTESRA